MKEKRIFSTLRCRGMRLLRHSIQSPYLLALLVGIYPIAFTTSNNWFMFSGWQNLLAVVSFSGLVFGLLAVLWRVLRRFVAPSRRVFAALCGVALVYFLRATFLELTDSEWAVAALAVALAAGLASISAARVVPGMNAVLATMSLFCALTVGVSMLGVSGAAQMSPMESASASASDGKRPSFTRWPNVYYFVPDAYPSGEALSRIFQLDSGRLVAELEARRFTVYPSAFSNYMHTLGSMLSTFRMSHHYYRDRVGNFEIVNARRWIVGNNPVIQTFRDNGYRIVFAHQGDYLFTQGCFVDVCAPSGSVGHSLELLFPHRLRGVRRWLTKSSLDAFEERLRANVDEIAESRRPHFLYAHMLSPRHSNHRRQSKPELAAFRKQYPEKLAEADAMILAFVDVVQSRDPDALIIIAADHGAWGLGSYGWADEAVLNEVPDSLIALDHLGVLLAIRWPSGPPEYHESLHSMINLFPTVFAHLAGDERGAWTDAPDDGYLIRETGVRGGVYKAMQDGVPLATFQRADQVP